MEKQVDEDELDREYEGRMIRRHKKKHSAKKSNDPNVRPLFNGALPLLARVWSHSVPRVEVSQGGRMKRLRLDEALEKAAEGSFEGWSDARIRAWKIKDKVYLRLCPTSCPVVSSLKVLIERRRTRTLTTTASTTRDSRSATVPGPPKRSGSSSSEWPRSA